MPGFTGNASIFFAGGTASPSPAPPSAGMNTQIHVVTFDTDAPQSKRLGYIGTDNR